MYLQRYSDDGRGNYNFSMYFGGNAEDSDFMYEHTPTTTSADYATFKLYRKLKPIF